MVQTTGRQLLVPMSVHPIPFVRTMCAELVKSADAAAAIGIDLGNL